MNELQKTIDALKGTYANPLFGGVGNLLAKSTFSQNGSAISGMTYYDLEPGAKLLYPVLTPLRNIIPRVSGRGGIQANWRAITAVNSSGVRIGVSGGNRGGVIAVTTQDYIAAYRGIGLEGNVDFEAQYAAEGFDDVRALAALSLLQSVMIGEEQMILGGNNSVALGTTGTPTLVSSTTGGTLVAQTWSVICVALTLDAIINGSISGGIQGAITRTNADASSDTFGGGAARKSSAATSTTTGSTSSIAATVAITQGAFGYAWFWGLGGSELIGAITTLNSVSITAAATGTQNASALGANDNSTNSLAFDGLLTQCAKSGSGGYNVAQATGTAGTGTPLTADGSGGIVEIDAMLKYMWDTWRLSPTVFWVNSQEALNISKKILQGSTNSNLKYYTDIKDGMIAGGVMVKEYLNRFSMTQGGMTIPIKIHPNMPAGTLFAFTAQLPYPLSNVSNVAQIRTRQEYYQLEWPLRSRKYEYGVYADEVLQHFAPFSMGLITNIGNG